MGYTFDYFVGQLTCPCCGFVTETDESTNMQTKICALPNMKAYGVGSMIELDSRNIEDSGYLLVNERETSDTFTLIDSWECPSCEAPYNWAQVKVKQGVIESVDSIDLSEEAISGVNYITEECEYLDWTIDEKGVRQHQ